VTSWVRGNANGSAFSSGNSVGSNRSPITMAMLRCRTARRRIAVVPFSSERGCVGVGGSE
jgi:hypothetical protein